MSQGQASGLLAFLFFIVQPILLGIYARKIYRRAATLWALLALVSNIGIEALFEWHMAAPLIVEAAFEVGTAIILSTIVILATLELLGGGPQARAGEDFRSNFRRGLFRIWVLISGSWIIFCAKEYLHDCTYPYACDFFGSGFSPIYFDIGKWFIGPPALAFVIGLAACWAIDGFRRSMPTA